MRQSTPVIYASDDAFPIGGSKVLRQGTSDRLTLIGAGATVHEALNAHEQLRRDGISVRVVDAYSIKPIDVAGLRAAADATGLIVTVEDHYPAGGLGEAVLQALADRPVPVTMLAVDKTPMSGTAEDLRDFAGISAAAIVRTVHRLVAGEDAGSAVAGRRSSGDRS
ncbi:MAG: transketolase C-terminal domain-containing protein [Vicinamibacterales bacterium]